jgi:hypothetical protein
VKYLNKCVYTIHHKFVIYTVVINIFEYFVFYYILHHDNCVSTAILLPGILYWDTCLGVCGTVYRGVLVQFVTVQSSMPLNTVWMELLACYDNVVYVVETDCYSGQKMALYIMIYHFYIRFQGICVRKVRAIA